MEMLDTPHMKEDRRTVNNFGLIELLCKNMEEQTFKCCHFGGYSATWYSIVTSLELAVVTEQNSGHTGTSGQNCHFRFRPEVTGILPKCIHTDLRKFGRKYEPEHNPSKTCARTFSMCAKTFEKLARTCRRWSKTLLIISTRVSIRTLPDKTSQ